MKIDIYGDGISYVTDEVSGVKACEANLNEENRIKFVTDLAAVSRGKNESKNPPARYKSLLKEAAPQLGKDGVYPKTASPSRPVEFLAVVLRYFIAGNMYNICDTNYGMAESSRVIAIMSPEEFNNSLGQHSFIENGKIYTNMRAVLNAGIPYEKVPYNTEEDLSLFIALKAQIPMYVWNQTPNTHVKISKEAQSDRVAENNNYWLPSDFREKVYEYKQGIEKEIESLHAFTKEPIYYLLANTILSLPNRDDIVDVLINGDREKSILVNNEKTVLSPTQGDVQEFFKELGYPREIYSRAMYYFKYKEVVMTGWYNDPKVWRHLFVERNANLAVWKNWTQEQTKQFVKAIRYIVEGESDD